MSDRFWIRLVGTPPTETWEYFEDGEAAGSEPATITCEWTDHPRADLERVMSMLTLTGYEFEVRGLTRVDSPFDPDGYRWEVDGRKRKGTSPQAIHAGRLEDLEKRRARQQAAYDKAQAAEADERAAAAAEAERLAAHQARRAAARRPRPRKGSK